MPLADLNPPEWLGDEAKRFWTKHARQLVADQTLNSRTADLFALMADAYGRLRLLANEPTSRTYLDLQKHFTSLAKLFRMSPAEKVKVKEDRHTDMGEVPYDM